MKEKLAEIIGLQIFGSLKFERAWKSGHVDLEPVINMDTNAIVSCNVLYITNLTG